MKKLTALLALLVTLASATLAADAKLSPIVSVDLGGPILNFVGTCAKAKDAEAGELIKNLRSVRVRVYDFEGEKVSMSEIQNEVRAQSQVKQGSDWSRIVTVSKPEEALVEISVRMKNANEVSGVIAAIANKEQKGVLVEIEGDIRADQVEKLVRRIQTGEFAGIPASHES